MTTPLTFKFNPELPYRSVERAINFFEEFDSFLMRNKLLGGTGISRDELQLLFENGPDADTGYTLFKEMQERISRPGYSMTSKDSLLYLQCTTTLAIHLGVHALLAETPEASLEYITDAEKLRIHADGLLLSGSDSLARTQLARKAAYAANASRNEPHKTAILNWYAEYRHNYTSIESAAAAACKLEPVSHRTAAKWISDWRKNNLKN